MVPIGRGQRELVTATARRARPAVAVDTIINQKGKDLFCVTSRSARRPRPSRTWCASSKSTTPWLYLVVAASASESAAMQYIAPYSGCTMGEYFRDRGQDALIIYDDLTKAGLGVPADLAPSCAARRGARRIRATSSTCTRGSWSAARAAPRPGWSASPRAR